MHAPCSPSRSPRRFSPGLPLAGFLIALIPPSAHAGLVVTCHPGDSELACKLRSFLTMLDTAAWILGFLLIAAILAAVRAYRRKPRKLTPDDILPEDFRPK